jgi:hypothetical protein
MPRSNGEREALRALMAASEGAVVARTAALCLLRGLLVTTPELLHNELRPLTAPGCLLVSAQPVTTVAATPSSAAASSP